MQNIEEARQWAKEENFRVQNQMKVEVNWEDILNGLEVTENVEASEKDIDDRNMQSTLPYAFNITRNETTISTDNYVKCITW